ncbi:MAG: hypothetical protein ACYTGG_12055, partial [Planctomycetota bacterium]
MRARTRRQTISCPRCGYDLRGEIGRWRTSCPLRGRCVECGLDIDYGRVFVHARHPWLFEYDWRSRPLSRLVRTFSRALWAPRFWREVRLEDPVYLRPVAFVALTCILLAAAAVIGMQMHQQHEYLSSWSLQSSSGAAYWWERLVESVTILPHLQL